MTTLENYQLLHPELLTEDALIQVLRDRCVEEPQLKSATRNELVELFKRVALPLPQRTFDDSTHMGRKLMSLQRRMDKRGASAVKITSTSDGPSNVGSTLSNNDCNSMHAGNVNSRLKPPLEIIGSETKKIRLSKSPVTPKALGQNTKQKRKEISPEPLGCKKRQRITWP
ncbi:uncharacterized protein LOC107227286 isoform X1 [Neodiprion lecontei]|uniref:Uncharacterized protein LOC107227286 isoform X1 n=1 Tax=Neodiprion lecontei TaxID=441921 RepID=A0A6J0CBT6_NEOLC|nr:uncharacterized protein LOC107227286 isoform X1 [Neodiprion lecontei]